MMWCMHRTNIYSTKCRRLASIGSRASRHVTVRGDPALIDRTFAGDDINVEVDLAAIARSHGALADAEETARDDGNRSAHWLACGPEREPVILVDSDFSSHTCAGSTPQPSGY